MRLFLSGLTLLNKQLQVSEYGKGLESTLSPFDTKTKILHESSMLVLELEFTEITRRWITGQYGDKCPSSPMAEATDLNPVKCQFDPDEGHYEVKC